MSRQRLLQLTRLTAGYSLTSLVGPLFSILLTPLYMRALSPADYAVWDTSMMFGLLSFALGTLGLNGAISAFFYDRDDHYSRSIVTTATLMALGWSSVVALGLALLAPPLAEFTFGSRDMAPIIRLVALNVPPAVFNTLLIAVLRLRLAVVRANIVAITQIVLLPLTIVLFVLGWGWGVFGIQLATLLVSLVLALLGLALTWRDSWGRPDGALALPLLRAGLPFLPNTLAFWALGYLDRLLLPLFGISLSERGLYAVANRLASVLAIITTPFQSAWGPLALSLRHEPDAPALYSKVLTYFMAGSLGLALALGLFAHEILLVLALLVGKSSYLPAAPYVGLLSYMAVANGAIVCVGIGAYLAKRTAALAWATAGGALVNLILNLLLIPRFGIWGASWATALGYATGPVVLYVLAQRVYRLPFVLRPAVLALVAQAPLLLVGTLLMPSQEWLALLCKCGLLAAYAALLLGLRVLAPSEARVLLDALRRPRVALAALAGQGRN